MQGGLAIRVLVTGGSGFIGRAVIPELNRRGQQVIATTHVAMDDLTESEQTRWVIWDALSAPLPAVEWSEVRSVLHLANPQNPFDFPAAAALMYEVGVAATYRLLERARKEGLAHVAIASSGDVIGQTHIPVREDNVNYRPLSFYAACKACGEVLAQSYSKVFPVAVLRFFHPYGPNGDRFLINRLVRRVLRGEEIEIEGEDGLPINPVHITDLAKGIVLALSSGESGIFHFAGPDHVTLRYLIERIGEIAGRRVKVRSLQKEVNGNHIGIYKQSEILLGYHPRITLEDGLRSLVEHYCQSKHNV